MSDSNLISFRRLAGASIANVFYFVINGAMFLVLTPWMLRVWGKDSYGVWTFMLAILGFAGIANFGMTTSTIKFTAQYSKKESTDKLSSVITFSFLLMALAGVVAFFAIWGLRYKISTQIESSNSVLVVSKALGWVAFGVIPLFLGQVSRGIMLGLVYNVLVGAIALSMDVLLWIGALGIGLAGGDILHLGIWIFIVNLIRFITLSFAAWWVTRPLKIHFSWNTILNKTILYFAILTWLGSLGSTAFQSLDRILVGMFLGADAVGVYGIAGGVATRLYGIVGQFTQVLMPFASNYQEEGKVEQIKSIFRISSRWGACLLVLIASVLVIWMDIILSVWISPQFSADYANIFRIMVLAYATYSMVAPAYQVVVGMGKLKIPTIIMLISGLGMLSTLWFLASRIGLSGAAYANLAYSGVLLINIYAAYMLNLKPLRAVISDIGPLLLLLLFIAVFPYEKLDFIVRTIINTTVMLMVLWLALSGNKAQTLIKIVHR